MLGPAGKEGEAKGTHWFEGRLRTTSRLPRIALDAYQLSCRGDGEKYGHWQDLSDNRAIGRGGCREMIYGKNFNAVVPFYKNARSYGDYLIMIGVRRWEE
jgi:hypothetical protein